MSIISSKLTVSIKIHLFLLTKNNPIPIPLVPSFHDLLPFLKAVMTRLKGHVDNVFIYSRKSCHHSLYSWKALRFSLLSEFRLPIVNLLFIIAIFLRWKMVLFLRSQFYFHPKLFVELNLQSHNNYNNNKF